MNPYEFLDQRFLTLMNDIGRLGYEKMGADSFEANRGGYGTKTRRRIPRHRKEEILRHAREHLAAYESGIPHDHFGALDYQLAAAAFNMMLEFYFSQGER